MGLRVVDETVEPERERLKLVMAPEPRKPIDQALLPILQAISAVLAIRVILALAGSGAFALALIAALMPSWGSLTAAGLYDAGALLPIVLYAAFRRS